MSNTRYILYKGSMNPKNPVKAEPEKIKELSSFGYKQGTDYEIVSWKVLQEALGGKKFAHGGMMNMDEMTRPIGYAAGGPIPKNEFDALMAEFDTPENRAGPGEPVGLEKIIADKYAVDPRHTLPTNFPVDDKFLAREMGGDQGSMLDDAKDIKTLGMIIELQGVLSFDEIDKMKDMSPIEIEILYNNTFGEEN